MQLTGLMTATCLAVSLHSTTLFAQRADNAAPVFDFESENIAWALAQIESGHFKNPDFAKGSSGEVSRFQILPKVWRAYSPSRNYTDPELAWRVAYQILKDRKDWFVSATGRSPTAFDLYVMWNKPGVYSRVRFDRQGLPRKLREVAERFENLVFASRDIKLTWN